MIPLLLTNLAPMLFGAQVILTLVLVKGDICPGQRGRVHKLLPALGILWLAVASLKVEAFLVVFALFYFYSKVQTGKTRDKGPLWVLYLANGLSLSYVLIQASEQGSVAAGLATLLMSVFIGALFAQLLLVIARSRLQAFHKILPFTGIISGMGLVLAMLGVVYQVEPQSLAGVTQPIMLMFALMVAAVLIWCWHILSNREVAKAQLAIALFFALFATSGMQWLIQIA